MAQEVVVSAPFRALVTGADEHQGLAVIRGIGMGGVEVVAAGINPGCLGQRSRYATISECYTAPSKDPERFIDDIIAIAERTKPAVIVPSVESTLVLLSRARERIERIAPLAAPHPETLEFALDKSQTLALAGRLGVPCPRTVTGATAKEVLDRAENLNYPVAIKPRGNALHASTLNAISFKCNYARDRSELAQVLSTLEGDVVAVLVQEFARGTGRAVAAVCKHGEPLELFAYSRDRETPLSGGVSVLRTSIPVDDQLRTYTTALLSAIRWHGVAMVEFKYDAPTGAYTLMEINGRFQASTALCLDAGINMPLMVASLYAGWTLPAQTVARIGVTERWLRGDLMALRGALFGGPPRAPGVKPPRLPVVRDFIRDFRKKDLCYDELHPGDNGPAKHEFGTLLEMLGDWTIEGAKAMVRTLVPRSVRS
jgi:predicted ATP-grasp superfamily ATP-dependent carboligase